MGNLLKVGFKSKLFILLFVSTMLLSLVTIANSIQNKNSNNAPVTQILNMPYHMIEDITTTDSLNFYKEFIVTENTGSDQSNVIIDPVNFTEEQGYCYKDSIRLYKLPYGTGDEMVSQMYDMEPHAWETFSADPDFGKPTTNWEVNEFGTGKITVLPRYEGFKKVVQFFDPAASPSDYVFMNSSFSDLTEGTMYFIWWIKAAPTGIEPYAYLEVTEDLTGGFKFSFGPNNKWYYWDGSWKNTNVDYEANTTYFMKATFNCSTDKFSVYHWNETTLSWNTIISNFSFSGNANCINNFKFGTVTNAIATMYLAAVDTSWASGYEEDRILYISSAQVAFIDNLTASEIKSYRLYYNDTPTPPAGYSNITANGMDPITVTTDDGKATFDLTNDGKYIIDFDDVYGNDWNTDPVYIQYITSLSGGFGGNTVGTAFFGPVFAEFFMYYSANEYISGRCYKNGIFKTTAKNDVDWYTGFDAAAGTAHPFVDALYCHSGGAWIASPGGFYNDYTTDKGVMFFDDTNDKSTIWFQVWDENQVLNSNEVRMNGPGTSTQSGIGYSNPGAKLIPANSVLTFYQGIKDAGTTNVTEKQNFVEDLYDLMFDNPPTIGTVGSRETPPGPYFKQFTVTENTGSNQTNAIIDPVNFTEEQGYCYKDSIRLYAFPYGSSDEIVSQVYNIEQYAWETFSADPDFGKPTTNWEANEIGVGKITVLPRYGGFKKVVELYDPVDSSNDNATQLKYNFSGQSSGTVYLTWWIKSIPTGTQPYVYIYLWEGPTARVEFAFGNNGYWYYWDSTWINTGLKYAANTIYTMKLNFNCSTDKFYMSYWNDTTLSWSNILTNKSFCNGPASGITNVTIGTHSGCIGTGYIAAVDTSWASGYEEDRILYVSSAQVAFIDNFTALETKKYRLYYDDTPTAPAGYSNITASGSNPIIVTTDDGKVTFDLTNDGKYIIDFDDVYGNDWNTDPDVQYIRTLGGGGFSGNTVGTAFFGPVFVEVFMYYSANEYIFGRCYKSGIFETTAKNGIDWYAGFSASAGTAHPFVDALYCHSGGGWIASPGGYYNDYTIDKGVMFFDDTNDKSTIWFQVWDENQVLNSNEVRMNGPGASTSMENGIGHPAPGAKLFPANSVLTFYYGIKDTEVTGVSGKQNFMNNLYNLMIASPPTISPLGARNVPINNIKPNILEINMNQLNPGILDLINITVHVTDNTGISTVRIYTDLFGSFQYYDIKLVSGSMTNGYWSYETRVPLQANGKTISYSIWANDTNGLVSTSGTSQFTVKYYPIILIFIPGGGGDGGIVIIIVIASVAAAAIGASTYVITRRSSTTKMKKSKKAPPTTKMKAKTKKGMDLGADEIRRILAGSEKIQGVEPESYQNLKEIIAGPLIVIPRNIYLRVLKIKHLTDQEKEALLDDLAGLDDEQREKWLQKVERLEDF